MTEQERQAAWDRVAKEIEEAEKREEKREANSLSLIAFLKTLANPLLLIATAIVALLMGDTIIASVFGIAGALSAIVWIVWRTDGDFMVWVFFDAMFRAIVCLIVDS